MDGVGTADGGGVEPSSRRGRAGHGRYGLDESCPLSRVRERAGVRAKGWRCRERRKEPHPAGLLHVPLQPLDVGVAGPVLYIEFDEATKDFSLPEAAQERMDDGWGKPLIPLPTRSDAQRRANHQRRRRTYNLTKEPPFTKWELTLLNSESSRERNGEDGHSKPERGSLGLSGRQQYSERRLRE